MTHHSYLSFDPHLTATQPASVATNQCRGNTHLYNLVAKLTPPIEPATPFGAVTVWVIFYVT